MTPPRIKAEIPVVALEPKRAAAAIDVSESFMRERVLPKLRVIREGGKVLVPLSELRRWADEEARTTLTGDRA